MLQCYTVLRSVTQCYAVLHSVTQCYTVLHSVTQCYTVLRSVTHLTDGHLLVVLPLVLIVTLPLLGA